MRCFLHFPTIRAWTAACVVFVAGCTRGGQISLQEGDLLFQDLDCGPMCEAIEAVTEGANGRDYSHCAMVAKGEGEMLMVIEAVGEGVKWTTIEDFLKRSDPEGIDWPGNVTVGRLQPEYRPLISEAVSQARALVGAPYDRAFLPDNGAWYCSELIYESFRLANEGQPVFALEPMTFKAPESDSFYAVWVDYYRQLGMDIPQGVPGLNPGSISRSEAIEILPADRINWSER